MAGEMRKAARVVEGVLCDGIPEGALPIHGVSGTRNLCECGHLKTNHTIGGCGVCTVNLGTMEIRICACSRRYK